MPPAGCVHRSSTIVDEGCFEMMTSFKNVLNRLTKGLLSSTFLYSFSKNTRQRWESKVSLII